MTSADWLAYICGELEPSHGVCLSAGCSASSHSGDIEALSAAGETYFQEATSLIDSTDELVLQRLNSPDPAKQ